MKTKQEMKFSAVPGETEDILPDDDMNLTTEEWMDVKFGRRRWVRDSWHDKFIVPDETYRGPGIAYLVIDRQRRRSTTIVPPNRMN